ncbi:MAG: hypothetical protein JW959_03300, partial [Pirellulales bacterium]|nr:hypothetical protein [Pirellulales bacterium]
DPDGLKSSSITIDDVLYSANGPWAANSGVIYTKPLADLEAGVHDYVITAVDLLGNVSALPGSFTLNLDWVDDDEDDSSDDAVDEIMSAY